MGYVDTAMAIWGKCATETSVISSHTKTSAKECERIPKSEAYETDETPSPFITPPTGPSLYVPPADVLSDLWPIDPALLPRSVLAGWPPRPAELANWPTSWRERWGVRANELADGGEPWDYAEWLALVETCAGRVAAGLSVEALPGERDEPVEAFKINAVATPEPRLTLISVPMAFGD